MAEQSRASHRGTSASEVSRQSDLRPRRNPGGVQAIALPEAIEHADPKPIEAARAAGASPGQVITHAVLPQALPQLSDITICRWEDHFRASAVLGIVGAGGIGFELIAALRLMRYDQVPAILPCILACVVVVDSTGSFLRRQLK